MMIVKSRLKQIILLILQGSEWLAVLFTILNSSQGVWILVFHILLNKKAVKEVTLHGRHMTTRFKVNFENGSDFSTEITQGIAHFIILS